MVNASMITLVFELSFISGEWLWYSLKYVNLSDVSEHVVQVGEFEYFYHFGMINPKAIAKRMTAIHKLFVVYEYGYHNG